MNIRGIYFTLSTEFKIFLEAYILMWLERMWLNYSKVKNKYILGKKKKKEVDFTNIIK